MTYNTIEQEAIELYIALDTIGDIANKVLLEPRDIQLLPEEPQAYFYAHVH